MSVKIVPSSSRAAAVVEAAEASTATTSNSR